jgi:hypothetical protein
MDFMGNIKFLASAGNWTPTRRPTSPSLYQLGSSGPIIRPIIIIIIITITIIIIIIIIITTTTGK